MIAIGKLDQRIAIERPEHTGDGSGGENVGFARFGSVWARIISDTRGSALTHEKLPPAEAFIITMRYRNDVTAGWHLVAGDQRYLVASTADVDGKHRFLKCLCFQVL